MGFLLVMDVKYWLFTEKILNYLDNFKDLAHYNNPHGLIIDHFRGF